MSVKLERSLSRSDSRNSVSLTPKPKPRNNSSNNNNSNKNNNNKDDDDDDKFFLDCKVAYLSVMDSLSEPLKSKKDLNRGQLQFSDFCNICRKNERTTTKELLAVFHTFDINGDGYFVSMLMKLQEEKFREAERKYERRNSQPTTPTKSPGRENQNNNRLWEKPGFAKNRIAFLEKPNFYKDGKPIALKGSFYVGDDGDVRSYYYSVKLPQHTRAPTSWGLEGLEPLSILFNSSGPHNAEPPNILL
ncbi:hypothetical protein HELRODRAFT_178893 [Helobdella robusta]|uniref:EF-hand domain-containing protein n=1 Tax=Helobdella robusta TaxID=6412 RepID=T1FDV2_HELRO|nr:hypothetical protein HELRODRAFT_178893 [Helobdella robusta]ESN95973.1 hypothetical protein HELRODRAFT_178893 [Helobdella robusta]